MERLKTGVYKDIYNYNPKAFEKMVGKQQEKEDEEEQQEQEEGESFQEYVAMDSED